MAKYAIKENPRTRQAWDDLAEYLNFCKEYGYFFDEKDLYRRETPWGLFQRTKQGKHVRNNWIEDARRMRGL